MLTIDPGQVGRTGYRSADSVGYMAHNCKGNCAWALPDTTDGDQDEERAHGDWPYQQNVAWLWQRYQTPANIHRLAKLPCVA